MSPELEKQLLAESAESRAKGTALIEYANRLDEALAANKAVSGHGYNFPPKKPGEPLSIMPTVRVATANGIVHTSDQRLTQPEALRIALVRLGRPATVEEIIAAVSFYGIVMKPSTPDNLRSVMSRDERFESVGSGQWRLNPQIFNGFGQYLPNSPLHLQPKRPDAANV